MTDLNDRRVAIAIQALIDRRIDAHHRRTPQTRYGIVDGDADATRRTVNVRLYGIPEPSPGFVYSGFAPRDGDHVRVVVDPKGDRYVDAIMGRDWVASVAQQVLEEQPTPGDVDRARGVPVWLPSAPGTPVFVQAAHAEDYPTASTRTATFGVAPTPGSLLVAFASTRFVNGFSWPVGWTEVDEWYTPSVLAFPDHLNAIAWKIADGSETSVTVTLASGQEFLALELIEVSAAAYASHARGAPANSATQALPSVTPVAGEPCMLVGTGYIFHGQAITSQPAGYTERVNGAASGGGNSIRQSLWTRDVASAAGSYSASIGYAAVPGNWSGAHIVLAGIGTPATSRPEATDGDDATYLLTSGAEVARLDLATAYRITRARVRVGCATAGSKTYELRGANQPDFSDEVSLASVTFTAAGSYATNDLAFVWTNATTLRYFRLMGPAGSRRVHTIELYELKPGALIVDDPRPGFGAGDIDGVLAAIFGAIVTDHGALTGLGDDDHPQYALDTDLSTHTGLPNAHHNRQHSITSGSDHTFPGGTTTFLRADGSFAAPPGGGGSTTVQEADGTPSVASVSTIKVGNGDLTDEGGGVVRIKTAADATGVGGGSATPEVNAAARVYAYQTFR